MFWLKTLQKVVDRHFLTTAPTRVLLFVFAIILLSAFCVISEGFDGRFNVVMVFDHYQVSPRIAHFFKRMGNANMSSTHRGGNSTTTIDVVNNVPRDESQPLFELGSKLNPVFLEHGELNVRCKFQPYMDLKCFYVGVIKQPKYYIQEVTFENSVPDTLPYKFNLLKDQNPTIASDGLDIYSKLSMYYYIFENSPAHIARFKSLRAISETSEFKKIRERVIAVYSSAVAWAYISNYNLWVFTMFFVFSQLMILCTKCGIMYTNGKSNITGKTKAIFLTRLENYSIVQVCLCFLLFVLHRLTTLLNSVSQSFAFSSITKSLTLNPSVTVTEGVSLFTQLMGVVAYLWILTFIFHITHKDGLVKRLSPSKELGQQLEETK